MSFDDDLDLQETDVPSASLKPPRGRGKKIKQVTPPLGAQPLHLRPASHATIYVPKDATMGPHKVDVPKRTSDTVML